MATETVSPNVDDIRRALSALIEAQVMAESIEGIASKLIEENADKAFGFLEAIVACTQRLDRAVTPIIEDMIATGAGACVSKQNTR